MERLVGERLRVLRTESGLTQDDVARASGRVGLDWSRSKVALLEVGKHPLSAADLLALPLVLTVALHRVVVPDELFGDTDEYVALTPHLQVPVASVRAGLSAWFRSLRAKNFKAKPRLTDLAEYRTVVELPPGTRHYMDDRLAELRDDAVQKASRRLGVSATSIVSSAHRLWGRGLVAEREERLADTEVTDQRSRQARRGHVTRQLLAELAAELNAELTSPDESTKRTKAAKSTKRTTTKKGHQ